ncbi:ABC transporter substrate-binding protein [Mesorhizobium sp. CAU 1741]|uniref:ABC transporter substrate-binding protein n=1 Tax=Mesorhizobium sp. CAU 1741 TaxID=3140366 RepID=UPI00325C2137
MAKLAAAGLACLVTMPLAAADPAPRRVVSMNVCTDQLAMLVAGEGQLHSVSFLAADPGMSVLASQADAYTPNHGRAEEVFLMQPDLVLAGMYTAQPAVTMLRRLGFRVEQFAPESSFEGIRENIVRMGRLLGRERRAADLVAELDAGLAALKEREGPPLTVAVYSSNSYTSGPGSLSHAVIEAAGLTNIADRLGIKGVQRLPLEELVLQQPDLVVMGEQDYGLPALAQQNFNHPAFSAVATPDRMVRIPDRYWICGAPFTLEAVRMLSEAARKWTQHEAGLRR